MEADEGTPSEVVAQPRSRSKMVHLKAEHRDQLLLLVAELRKDPNSFPFQEPVHWQELGLWNYP